MIHVTTAVMQECPGPGGEVKAANDQAVRVTRDALARAEAVLVEAVTQGPEMAFALWRVTGSELDRAEGLQGMPGGAIEEAAGGLTATTRRLRHQHQVVLTAIDEAVPAEGAWHAVRGGEVVAVRAPLAGEAAVRLPGVSGALRRVLFDRRAAVV